MRDFDAYVRIRVESCGLPPAREAEIVEEIAEHMRDAYEEALDRGASDTEALAYAEAPFVPWEAFRESLLGVEVLTFGTQDPATARIGAGSGRSRRGPGKILSDFCQDLRVGLRTLGRRPLFAAIAVLTLGLGIGSTTAMFSIVDGVLIRDLPFRDPDNLVSVWKAWPSWQGREGLDYTWDHIQFPWADYQNVKRHASTLGGVAAFQSRTELTLRGGGAQELLSVGRASENLFDLLGVRPVLGRTFLDEEVPPLGPDEGARVALLSHELWSRRFGRDPSVLGRSITLGDSSYEVVGVLPPGFRLNSDLIRTHTNAGEMDTGLRDLWIPLVAQRWNTNSYELLARLSPGVTVEQARTEIQTLMTVGPEDQIARVQSRKDFLTKGFDRPLFLLLGAAGLLLLVACVNVAGLLVGEAALRQQEALLRSALGAGRGRILRQLLTESLLLGVAGAVLGVGLALAGTGALLSLAPPLPRLEEVALSGRVLLFAVTAGVGTSLLFGLAPAWSLVGRSRGQALQSRGQRVSRSTRSVQTGALSLQVALTVVLLVAGGLLGRSFLELLAVDPGFDEEGVLAVDLRMPLPSSFTPEETDSVAARLRQATQAVTRAAEGVPGVLEVSGTSSVPFGPGAGTATLHLTRESGIVGATHYVRQVLPNYHQAMGIPLLSGRYLTDADDIGAPGAILVSQSLANLHWRGESPLGTSVRFWEGSELSVVGVVGDVRSVDLGSPPEPTFYVSALQYPHSGLTLVVRTGGRTGDVVPTLRAALQGANPTPTVGAITPLSTLARDSEADDRFRTLLILTFAALATLLAAVGIFGVTARTVAARAREMGIRIALGAEARGLIGKVIRESMISAAVGAAVGLVGALWATRLIQHLLFGVESTESSVYLGVLALILIVCIGAAYLPARRVTRIAPMAVITEE